MEQLHGDEVTRNNYNNNQITSSDQEDQMELKRGPWTVEEDFTLINYVAHHGEGRWNSLARCAGLKRTGKSCRLRWLNYLRPDVRRGNITLEEQLLILELHSRWGNRWSKIAQHLPGRTDNEIKNYWRTRVQKHAKQLKCDVNSKQFKDAMRYLWMPRLVERIQAAKSSSTVDHNYNHLMINNNINNPGDEQLMGSSSNHQIINHHVVQQSSDSFGTAVSDLTETTNATYNNYNDLTVQDFNYPVNYDQFSNQCLTSPISTGYYNFNQQGSTSSNFMEQNSQWQMDGGDLSTTTDNLWDVVDDMWLLQQQFNINV